MAIVDRPEVFEQPHVDLAARRPLKDRVALVTGGSRGIGRATALALAEAGADVCINYQTSFQAAEAASKVAQEFGVRSSIHQADVSHLDEAEAMVAQIVATLGHVDILVNNAGITRDKSFLKMTKAMWDEVLGVNLTGPFNITHAVLPWMVESGWGRIINISSIVGQTGNFGQANYAVTKGGLIAFTMTLAREVARKGITVNAVAPGFIETDMTKDMPAVALETVKRHDPRRPPRRARRSRRRRRLPRQPAGQLHHRAGDRGQRRHVHVTA